RFLHLHEKVLDPATGADAPLAAVRDLREYLRSVIAEKRREPADDLISYVVRRDDLTETELLSVIQMFFDAGVDTVATMLTLGTFALLCHPEQLRELRADVSRVDGAVDELMRYLTIFQSGALTRTARE